MRINLFRTSLLPPSARKPALLKAAARRTLQREGGPGHGELNIVFMERRGMRALNRRYLGHAHDTDVIAFPYPPPPKGFRGDRPFGDVYVSAHRARVQAKELGHSVLEEVLTLIVHGTLHLLGCQDKTPRQRAAMFRRQEGLLRLLRPRRA